MPARVRDVADVNVGYAPRLGIVGRNDRDEVVERHRPDAQIRRHAEDAQGRGERRSQELNTSGIMPHGLQSRAVLRPHLAWSIPRCAR